MKHENTIKSHRSKKKYVIVAIIIIILCLLGTYKLTKRSYIHNPLAQLKIELSLLTDKWKTVDTAGTDRRYNPTFYIKCDYEKEEIVILRPDGQKKSASYPLIKQTRLSCQESLIIAERYLINKFKNSNSDFEDVLETSGILPINQ